jgi:hypothetical protein
MLSLLKPLSQINLENAKRPTLVLVAHATNPAGYPCALFVQRDKDANMALTLLQGEFNPKKEVYAHAASRILCSHFEMPPTPDGSSGLMIKEVGEPLGYFEHEVPEDRQKGTTRTLIYLPLVVSMKIRIREDRICHNPSTKHGWMIGRDIDTHATVMEQMRDAKKWLAHVEALTSVLRPTSKKKQLVAA